MLGNIGGRHTIKEVKTTLEHIGLYIGLILYTGIGAGVIETSFKNMEIHFMFFI